MRPLLLAAVVLATLAAGLRASRARPFLSSVGTLAAMLAFAFGAFAPVPVPLRTWGLVYAGTLLAKLCALGRDTAPLRPGRGLAYLFAYPGLAPGLAFRRDPSARRGAGSLVALLGVVEVAGAFAFAATADGAGWLQAGAYPAAWARMASLMLLLDGLFRATRGALLASGCVAERLSHAPWAAGSLAAFWGRRWNLLVARTLAADVYAPVKARAGRVAGVFAAFLASGVYHEALFTFPTGAEGGGHVVYFLAQATAVAAGSAWGRTPRFARAWAWAVMLATAPLFFGGPYPAAAPLERAWR